LGSKGAFLTKKAEEDVTSILALILWDIHSRDGRGESVETSKHLLNLLTAGILRTKQVWAWIQPLEGSVRQRGDPIRLDMNGER
jgi:hypothetical protein